VIGDDEVCVAQLDRGLRHLADAGATVGGFGVCMAVAAQGGAELGGTFRQRRALDGLEAAEVDRLLSAQALENGPLGDLAHALQFPQGPVGNADRQLIGPHLRERCGGAAEGSHAVARLLSGFQQEADPFQVDDRVAWLRHGESMAVELANGERSQQA
jgi:hypothetical protein